jgi:hypothetical protein
MSEWLPISTAPKDGTIVLLYCPEPVEAPRRSMGWEHRGSHVVVARWASADPSEWTDEDGWHLPAVEVEFGVYDDPSTDFMPVLADPTHWMPLPSPPEGEAR